MTSGRGERRQWWHQDVYTDISIARECCGFAIYFGENDSRNRSGTLKCLKSVQAETKAIAIACAIIARDTEAPPTFWMICTDCSSARLTAGRNFRNLLHAEFEYGAKHAFSKICRSVKQIERNGHVIDILWVRRESTDESIAVDRLASEAAMDAYEDRYF